jgi:hypothetical protein
MSDDGHASCNVTFNTSIILTRIISAGRTGFKFIGSYTISAAVFCIPDMFMWLWMFVAFVGVRVKDTCADA